jgi:hypothetical protein
MKGIRIGRVLIGTGLLLSSAAAAALTVQAWASGLLSVQNGSDPLMGVARGPLVFGLIGLVVYPVLAWSAIRTFQSRPLPRLGR